MHSITGRDPNRLLDLHELDLVSMCYLDALQGMGLPSDRPSLSSGKNSVVQ